MPSKNIRTPETGYPYTRVYSKNSTYKGPSPKPPLPYSFVKESGSSFWAANSGQSHISAFLGKELEGLKARAYDGFWGKARAKAEMAMNLVELEQSMNTLSSRLIQARRMVQALKHGQIDEFMHHSGVSPRGVRNRIQTRNRRQATKAAASTWLEVTFGWIPVITDVKAAIDVLQSDFDGGKVKGGARALSVYAEHPYIPPGSSDNWHDGALDLRVSVSGHILVTNPNLMLANQLGLINPATVFWDAVPFSFVLDWFLPVGKFLNSFTNDFGAQVVRPSTTWGCTSNCYLTDIPSNNDTGSYSEFHLERVASIDRPGLFARKRLPDPTVWLAVTSASLLIQQIDYFKSGR